MINPFLDACGATGPLLLNTESPGQTGGETRAFDLPFVIVGCDPRSDLRLAHAEVCDRHAYLQLVDGQLLWVDLGSRNGVHQDGKCRRLGSLECGQSIRIGPYRVRFLGDGSAPAPPRAGDARPTVALELSHRSVRRTRSDLPAGLSLVGSSSDCTLRVVDPSVSNFHCGLIHTTQGVWVVDLLGREGVKVNGQEISYARLFAGDVLQVGLSEIRLAPGSFSPLIPAPQPPQALPIEPPRPKVFLEPPPTYQSDEGAPNDPPFHFSPHGPAPTVLAVANAYPDNDNDDDNDNDNDNDPLPLAPGEPVDRLLGTAVAQIVMMRQQLMDEFRRAQALMFETFASNHDEQAALMNREIHQVRQLGQELQSLRADVEHARQSRAFVETSPEAEPEPISSADAPAAPLTRPVSDSQGFHGSNGRSQASPPPGPLAAPARVPDMVEPVHPHDEQAHALLCQRIAGFKQRQKSLWEKLLTAIPPGLQGKTTL